MLDTAAWLCVRDGRLLCARTRGRALFYLPGGKREPGEPLRECVVREAREELGVSLRRATLRPVAVFEAPADGHPEGVRVRMTCFTAAFHGRPRPLREVEELAWLAYADRQRTAPVDRLVFDWLRDRGVLG